MDKKLEVQITVSFKRGWQFRYGEQSATLEVPLPLMANMRPAVQGIASELFTAGLIAALKELAEKEKDEQDD